MALIYEIGVPAPTNITKLRVIVIGFLYGKGVIQCRKGGKEDNFILTIVLKHVQTFSKISALSDFQIFV